MTAPVVRRLLVLVPRENSCKPASGAAIRSEAEEGASRRPSPEARRCRRLEGLPSLSGMHGCMKRVLSLIALCGALGAFAAPAKSDVGAPETGDPWALMMNGAPADQLRDAFQEALERDPADAGAAYGLALVQQALGERERSVVTAVEGLKNAPGDPLAFLLQDLVGEDATFNKATTRLVTDALPLLTASDRMDPLVRFNLRWLAYSLAAKTGNPELRRKAFERAGFIPGAYFTKGLTERPRSAFYETWPAEQGRLGAESWSYWPIERPEARPPLPEMTPGEESIYLLLAPFQVAKAGEALVYVNAAKSMKVYLDDKPLLTKDIFTLQENPTAVRKVMLKAGPHRLLVKIHTGRGDGGIHLALLDAKGYPLPVTWSTSPKPPLGPPAGVQDQGEQKDRFAASFREKDPRWQGFHALWYRWVGDVASARIQMDQASAASPRCLAWNLWAGKMYLFEADDLPQKIAESRAERNVDRALDSAPGLAMARYYKAVLQGTNSDSDEDLATLRDLAGREPSDPRWTLALVDRLSSRGWLEQARRYLEEASSYHPECESVESAWIGFFRRLPDPAGEEQAIRRLSKLRSADPEWENYYEETLQLDRLHELVEDEARRYGDRDGLYDMQLAKVEIRMGRYDEARKRLERLARRSPKDPDAAFNLARACFLAGDEQAGLKAWSDLKRAKPDAFQVDLARWILGLDPLPFEDRHVSLKEVMRAERDAAPDAAPSSLLLDQLFTRVQIDGSSVERYHGIVRINDKEGVDREGEQSLPGQVILSLRTIKPDGRVLEPEQIPDKDSISMQGLEPGDVIEYEYLTLKGPSLVKKDAYLTTQVYLFQDIEKPFHHTQWFMEWPSSIPMQFFEQNLPSPGVRGSKDGLSWCNWEYRNMPRIAPEPDTPNKLLFVPMVEAVGGVTWKDLGLSLKEQVLGAFQVTPELEASYCKAVGDASSPAEKLKRIEDYLLKNVDGEQGQAWQDPTQTLLTRQGSRVPPACAFFKLAGIPYRILVAEAVPDRVNREDLPRLGQYAIPVVEVDLPGAKPEYLTLSSPYRNPVALPWYLQGARAMVATAQEPWKIALIPKDFSLWDSAESEEERTFLPGGDLKVVHRQAMDPDAGESLRGSFQKIEKDQLRRAIQMALSRQYGNADLVDYSVENLEDLSKPLTWGYTVVVHGYASVDGPRLTVPDPLPSLRLGQGLASLAERKLPLTTGGPIILHERLTFHLPPGAVLDYAPPQYSASNEFGQYSIESQAGQDEITVDRKVRMPFQVVWPKDYGRFSAFMRKVDAVESGQLALRLPEASTVAAAHAVK
jgi:tetratricopeptide (TPR) repeat protein